MVIPIYIKVIDCHQYKTEYLWCFMHFFRKRFSDEVIGSVLN